MRFPLLFKRLLHGVALVAALHGDAPDAPRLILETGGHQALITQLLFTANGQELVSASHDKTIRVWSVSPDGRRTTLARTFRGQSGPGVDGVLWAAALSPADAAGVHRWLAVGGSLAGANPADHYAVRLHDYHRGDVVALFPGHTNTIFALAFSPDGRWLASAGKDNTVRVWDLSSLRDGKLGAKPLILRQHRDHIYDLDWSATGNRLAAASYDHTVGLWDTTALPQGRVRHVATLQGHTAHVRTVAFHPDGSVLASGGRDNTIRLWRATDGQPQGVFAQPGHNVAALTFAPDGHWLLAGNLSPPRPKKLTLYQYPSGTMQQVFTKHDNTVVATAFHPNSRWIASGGGDQKEILLWKARTGDVLSRMTGKGRTISAVAFSHDAQTLSWGYTSRFQSINNRGPLEHRFDLQTFTRMAGGLSASAAVRAHEKVGNIAVAVERGGPRKQPYRLQVYRKAGFGKKKRLGTIQRNAKNGYEHSAYTLTPDGKHALSGGQNGVLALYTLTGVLRATLVGHAGEIQAVAISKNGHWALSGSNDQTISLWSLRDLPSTPMATIFPTLSLFPATDGEWIAWTPEGFFTASPKGTRLMGFRINKGVAKQAQYVSVDQLYDRFYRPDLLHARLHGDPKKLWKKHSAQTDVQTVLEHGLPPRVTLAAAAPRTTASTPKRVVQATIHDQGGGIGKVVWQVNGVTTTLERPDVKQGARVGASGITLTKQLALTPGVNTITVTAYEKRNAVASASATLDLTFRPPPPPPAPAPPPLPTRPALHLLVVGINRYRDQALQLNYAVPDGQAIVGTFRKISTPLFETIRVTTVYDDQATTLGIANAFERMAPTINVRDVFVLYMAGHGVTLEGQYYFLPQDFRYVNDAAIQRNAISQEHLQGWLATVPARKSLVLIDTCESGSFSQSFAAVRGMSEKAAIAKLSRATGRATIVAATDNQPAIEGYRGHGVFTYVLLQALDHADAQFGNRDGLTGLFEVAAYVNDQVPTITMKAFNFEQIPQVYLLGTDFPIGMAPKG